MKQATIQDLKLELWLRQRNSGFIIWTTKNGKNIPIKYMSTDHLINTFNMLLRQEKEVEWFKDIIIYNENDIL